MKRRDQNKTEVSQAGCESVNESPAKESALLVLYQGPEGIDSHIDACGLYL